MSRARGQSLIMLLIHAARQYRGSPSLQAASNVCENSNFPIEFLFDFEVKVGKLLENVLTLKRTKHKLSLESILEIHLGFLVISDC